MTTPCPVCGATQGDLYAIIGGWLATIVCGAAIGFAFGVHYAPTFQDQDRAAVEAEARADVMERALIVTAARLDTIIGVCYGVHRQNVAIGRAMAEWPIRITGGRNLHEEVTHPNSSQASSP